MGTVYRVLHSKLDKVVALKLLSAIRFLSDRGPKRLPKQKLFDQRLVSVSALVGDEDRTFEPADDEMPEKVFMKRWAEAVLANARRHLEIWCYSKSRPDWYEIFCTTHFPPPGTPHLAQQAIADRFHCTRDQVRYGLEEVRRQFLEFLRAEVADQAGSDADLDIEVGELQQSLVG